MSMQAWVIGNWKQNPATSNDVSVLLDELLSKMGTQKQTGTTTSNSQCKLMVAPSCIHLSAVSERLASSTILSAAQDISTYSANVGAYTGDCSAQQVADAGATWTILGHSERRQYRISRLPVEQVISCIFGELRCGVLYWGNTRAV